MTNLVKSEHNGYEITGHVYSDGSISWKCDAIEKKNGRWAHDTEEFPDYRELIKALDQYDLECRKKFTNRTAYTVKRGWNKVDKTEYEEVEVTSITPNGKEAWIKCQEGRRKVALASLYGSEQSVRLYCKYFDETLAKFESDKAGLQTALDASAWKPQF